MKTFVVHCQHIIGNFYPKIYNSAVLSFVTLSAALSLFMLYVFFTIINRKINFDAIVSSKASNSLQVLNNFPKNFKINA